MNRHFVLFLCTLSAMIVSCQLEDPPVFSTSCPDFTYIASDQNNDGILDFKCLRSDMQNVRAEGDPCLSMDNHFVMPDLCSTGFPYCLEDREKGNGCVKSCPKNYHEIVSVHNDQLRYVCEADSLENCGKAGYNCEENVPGWKTGACINGECVLKTCRDTHKHDVVNNICLTQNQSCGNLELNCTEIPVSDLTQQDWDDAMSSGHEVDQNATIVDLMCVVSSENPDGACQWSCGEELQFCDNAYCINPETSASFCGARENCTIFETCAPNQSCEPGPDGVYHCKCINDLTPCEDNKCYDLQSTLNRCGSCDHDCTVIDGWVYGSCVDGRCQAIQCKPGFHISDQGCTPDSVTECGNALVDCAGLEGWNDVACTDGNCTAASCNPPLVLYNNECGITCGTSACTKAQVAHSTAVACESAVCKAAACEVNYSPNGLICCPDVEHGEILVTQDNTCQFRCLEEAGFVSNGKICCEAIEHGVITPNSMAICSFTCVEDPATGEIYEKSKDGESCVLHICSEKEQQCDGNAFQVCHENTWVTSQTCVAPENGFAECDSVNGCRYSCSEKYVYNGKRCCSEVAHGTIAVDLSDTCSLTCDDGFIIGEDGYSCIKKNCNPGETQCVNTLDGGGMLQQCSGNAWVNTVPCDNGSSCNADSSDCGKCQNGTKSCQNEGTVGKLTTCANGDWGDPWQCDPQYSCNEAQNACGECVNDTVRCSVTENGTQTCQNGAWGAVKPCAQIANAVSACSAGICDFTCNAGFHKSVDGSLCEPDTTDNCGPEHNNCSALIHVNGGYAVCRDGACDFECESGCRIGDVCADLQSDINNCGSCGRICDVSKVQNASEVNCYEGNCIATGCAVGFDLIGNACVTHVCAAGEHKCENNKFYTCEANRWVNPQICDSPENGNYTCDNTTGCDFTCNEPEFCKKSTGCVSVLTDMDNCGACGMPCRLETVPNSAAVDCINGSCQAVLCDASHNVQNGQCVEHNCDAGDHKCDGNTYYTCRDNKWNGTVCPAPDNATSTCTGGNCDWICNAPDYCKGRGETADRCVSIQNDINNCGGCGAICNNTISGLEQAKEIICENTRCKATSCNDNYIISNGKCVKYVCTTGEGKCEGYVYSVCNKNQWTGEKTCSAPDNATPQCDKNSGCSWVCNTGYCEVDKTSCADTKTDMNHCGACNSICDTSKVNHAQTVKCENSKCIAKSCNADYDLDNGQCVAHVCSSGEHKCEGSRFYTCDENSWGTGIDCPDGCNDTGCIGHVCSTDEVKCENKILYTCRSNDWGTGENCPAPSNATPKCDGNSCSWSCNTNYCPKGSGCVSVSNDNDNCGGCGNTCSISVVSNSTAVQCNAGKCEATACQSGMVVVNGKCETFVCETNNKKCEGNKLYTCNNNSWGTGSVCSGMSIAYSQPVCEGNACTWACVSGYCKSAGACVSKQTDMNNCGECGFICDTSKVSHSETVTCDRGQCKATKCKTDGFHLDNGACIENECENGTHKCAGNNYYTCIDNKWSAGTTCGAPQNATPTCDKDKGCGHRCNDNYCPKDGLCVSNQTDMDNCGSCGVICNKTKVNFSNAVICDAGKCIATECQTGYDKTSDGRCVRHVCYTGETKCSSGRYYTCSDNDWGDGILCNAPSNATASCDKTTGCGWSCNVGYCQTSTGCVSKQTDMNNCGSCGNVCNTTKVTNSTSVACQDGICIATGCGAGTVLHDGACVPRVCYDEETKCEAPKSFYTCSDNDWGTASECHTEVENASAACKNNTECGFVCNTGYCTKDNACVSTNDDMDNCGSCNNKCDTSKVNYSTAVECTSGQCKATACDDEHYLSSGECVTKKCTTGDISCSGGVKFTCEANDWGTGEPCEHPENSTPTCKDAKTCSYACNSGYCPGGSDNCVSTQTDMNNCGSCGSVCNTSAVSHSTKVTCDNGTCKATKCATGYDLISGRCVTHVCTENEHKCEGNKYYTCHGNSWSEYQNCTAPGNATATCDKTLGCGFSCNSGYCKVGTECVSIQNNVNNCGSCGYNCEDHVQYATGVDCRSAQCVATACVTGYDLIGGRCEKHVCTTGEHKCEKSPASLFTCSNNSWGSGNLCPTPANGSAVCNGSFDDCAIRCNSGYCVSGDNCVSKQTDMNNCGACNSICSISKVEHSSNVQCVAGMCKATSCATGYDLTSTGTCVEHVCSTGEHKCENNAYYTCGDNSWGLGVVCGAPNANGTAACDIDTGCTFNCNPGHCIEGNTCVSNQTSVSNCGTCGHACHIENSTTVECEAGVCKPNGCLTGYVVVGNACVAQTCSPGTTSCVGDSFNTCSDDGMSYNSVNCRDMSPSHSTPTCDNTKGCGWTCNDNYCQEGSSCVEPKTTTHCGSCDTPCTTANVANSSGVSCSTGTCKATSCTAPYVLADDGSCVECLGGAKCEFIREGHYDYSVCIGNSWSTISCNCPFNGYSLCDSSTGCSFGCDSGYCAKGTQCVSMQTDMDNCGSCNSKCDTTNQPNSIAVTCSSGTCIATACVKGYVLVNNQCQRYVCTNGDTKCDYEHETPYSYTCENNRWIQGRVCPRVSHATSLCKKDGSECSFVCNTGYCQQGNACESMQTSMNHCGGCGNVCNTAAVPNSASVNCEAGICKALSCRTGYELLDGNCVPSGSVCPTDGVMICLSRPIDSYQYCYNHLWEQRYCTTDIKNAQPFCDPRRNECSFICNSGFDRCKGAYECTSLSTTSNCGSCGNRCSAALIPHSIAWVCEDYQCKATECDSGYAPNASGECELISHSCDTTGYQEISFTLTNGTSYNNILAYCVKNLSDLTNVATAINKGEHYPDDNINDVFLLTTDIPLNSDWTPIGNASDPFGGIFYGYYNGSTHKIMLGNPDIEKHAANSNNYGVFGYVNDAIISNLTIAANLDAKNYSNVGILAGSTKSAIIENVNIVKSLVTNTGDNGGLLIGDDDGSNLSNINAPSGSTLAGANNIGGLVGNAKNTKINMLNNSNRSEISATVTGSKNVGGVIGNGLSVVAKNITVSKSSISCSQVCGGVFGNLSTSKVIKIESNNTGLTGDNHVGGFVGVNKSAKEITDCHVTFDDRAIYCAKGYCGGFAGQSDSSVIKDCSVTSQNCMTQLDKQYIGGFVGYSDSDQYSDCFAEINFNLNYNSTLGVGGFTGYSNNTQYSQCAYYGYIVAGYDTGGFVGVDFSTATYDKCYAIAEIKAGYYQETSGTGGFIGRLDSKPTVRNGYQYGKVSPANFTKNGGQLFGFYSNPPITYNVFFDNMTNDNPPTPSELEGAEGLEPYRTEENIRDDVLRELGSSYGLYNCAVPRLDGVHMISLPVIKSIAPKMCTPKE